ncbi:hypothetical protein GCM10023310_17330 [Paenibacillus vulneris]|uniref:Uncharacterized protein n=1 Tax=Paenibacillus vulneris TaxID=1133364 RepID=A0ABW3UME5_9BACL|nr:hypothetical protein [Paenibacillus sp. 32352]
MRHIQRLLCITLLTIAFVLPTTAFASTGSENQSGITNQKLSSHSSWEQFFSSLFSHKKDKDDDWKHATDKDKDFKDWYDKHKDDCPEGESDDIWRKWFCY